MRFSELTTEEALRMGVITRGKWNDESWEIEMPKWRKALELAEKYHKESGNTYIDRTKELRTGIERPYIDFIQGLLRILTNEVYIGDDRIQTIAALYNILKITDCDDKILQQEFGEDMAEYVKHLQQGEEENFGEQLTRLSFLKNHEGSMLTYIFLAAKLFEQRVIDRCLHNSWEEDVPYYQHMIDELEQYGMKVYREKKWDRAIFLGEKLRAQLKENMDLSRNCNKTAEELYAG